MSWSVVFWVAYVICLLFMQRCKNKVHFLISNRLSVDHMLPLLRLVLDVCLLEESYWSCKLPVCIHLESGLIIWILATLSSEPYFYSRWSHSGMTSFVLICCTVFCYSSQNSADFVTESRKRQKNFSQKLRERSTPFIHRCWYSNLKAIKQWPF